MNKKPWKISEDTVEIYWEYKKQEQTFGSSWSWKSAWWGPARDLTSRQVYEFNLHPMHSDSGCQGLRALLYAQFLNTYHWWIMPVKLQLVEYFINSIIYLTFPFEVLSLVFRNNILFEMKKCTLFQNII